MQCAAHFSHDPQTQRFSLTYVKLMAQSLGILCHITSLPRGLQDAERFLDFAKKFGANIWQMLPITPPDEHGSPYASQSAFAAWDDLGSSSRTDMDCEQYWLNDWLLYQKLKEKFDNKPWYEWPQEYRDRDKIALENIEVDDSKQSKFMGRWNEIKKYSNSIGISLVGDLPIFVSHDSADVWAHRELFLLDKNGMPKVVAGVPPDYFSKNGQKWGTVLYNWEAHSKENWKWWRERIRRMMRLFDIIRIDHFRGFHSAWAIPFKNKTARNGKWLEGPKDELLKAIIEESGGPEKIIAEDLGIIPEEVTNMRKRHNLRGMRVLQFAFDDNNPNNPHRPENIETDNVVYTGTHDNDTTKGWWGQKHRRQVVDLMKEGETICQTMIRLAKESRAEVAIIPLQDIMELGSEARMNIPGTVGDNWNWRFSWDDL